MSETRRRLKPEHVLDAGGGHFFSKVLNQQDELVGFIEDHPRKDDPSRECSGSVALEGSTWAEPGRTWTMSGEWPEITLEPSLLCTACDSHGWLRNGRWEDA